MSCAELYGEALVIRQKREERLEPPGVKSQKSGKLNNYTGELPRLSQRPHSFKELFQVRVDSSSVPGLDMAIGLLVDRRVLLWIFEGANPHVQPTHYVVLDTGLESDMPELLLRQQALQPLVDPKWNRLKLMPDTFPQENRLPAASCSAIMMTHVICDA